MDHPSKPPPPRVLLVMPDQWHRALLRAQLRDLGYDAVGAPDLAGALLYPAQDPGRGPVGLILVDHRSLAALGEALLSPLLERHGAPAVLIAPAGLAPAAARWVRVLNRPVSIEEIVDTVREILPTAPGASQPID